jgi:hypothetical protein
LIGRSGTNAGAQGVKEGRKVERRFKVKLNVRLIIANLAREDGRDVSEAEVVGWLREAGFETVDAAHWTVAEKDLGQLKEEEVLEVEEISTGGAC